MYIGKKMTLEEKLDVSVQAIELKNNGDEEGYIRLSMTIPLAPHLAEGLKKLEGLDFLLNGGWNLVEVEEAFGPDWLKK